MAFDLTQAVEALMARTRAFYYEVMLSGCSCTQCADGLKMVGESRCECIGCGHVLDPTIAFQRCTTCDGVPRLRVSRYICRRCGREVPSRFVFDGHVYDRELLQATDG